MEEIITNEFLQYKAGFINGKNDVIEFTRLGKIIDLKEKTKIKSITWYSFGYQDAIEYYLKILDKSVDIVTIRVKDVIKESFSKRVLEYNLNKGTDISMGIFKGKL